jgi:hypothetical protein
MPTSAINIVMVPPAPYPIPLPILQILQADNLRNLLVQYQWKEGEKLVGYLPSKNGKVTSCLKHGNRTLMVIPWHLGTV